MNLNEINYFQFENLIKNRVPFVLVALGVDLDSFYKDFHQRHLAQVLWSCSPEEFLREAPKKFSDLGTAFVFICTNGELSKKLCNQSASLGYLNTYFCGGGLQALQGL